MRIAFPTNGQDLDAEIEHHFGKARNFLVYDQRTGQKEVLVNPEVAGKKELPPDLLARNQVEALVVHGVGKKAIRKLKAYNIQAYQAIPGSIGENLKELEKDQLDKLKDSSC